MKCIDPIAGLGCGRLIDWDEFLGWDKLTQSEFWISGLCTTCQDFVFAEEAYGDEPEWEDGEVPCNCLGLSHRNDCPNWVLPI